ncbi:hypothetical protein ACFFMN_22885 [Planobispora siamensis]|uniref:Uncharacterized protein n=1 Tax=Planobispora siamensis TaxID=936338 RepID=A0A8J3STN4_9ACTN|nr:hypothetical protein [Planobispora siamensis]GIH95413.1 hypothetical protein Psi01_60430 [Planobispora siamensis]
MRVPVTAEQVNSQVVEVRHNLGSSAVQVTCYRSDGDEVGYLAAVPITSDIVEVMVVPGSGVAEIEVVTADAPAANQASS